MHIYDEGKAKKNGTKGSESEGRFVSDMCEWKRNEAGQQQLVYVVGWAALFKAGLFNLN